jgi:uncharacterized protein YfiM (DUF2279 family)
VTPAGAALSLALAVLPQPLRSDPGGPGAPRPDSATQRDAWFGADKLKHFFVAAFTQTVAYSALQAARVRHDRALGGAWAVTAAVSVAKEFHDQRTTGLFSVRDLVWDAAGAGAASILLTGAQRRGTSGDPLPAPGAPLASRRAAFGASAGRAGR